MIDWERIQIIWWTSSWCHFHYRFCTLEEKSAAVNSLKTAPFMNPPFHPHHLPFASISLSYLPCSWICQICSKWSCAAPSPVYIRSYSASANSPEEPGSEVPYQSSPSCSILHWMYLQEGHCGSLVFSVSPAPYMWTRRSMYDITPSDSIWACK